MNAYPLALSVLLFLSSNGSALAGEGPLKIVDTVSGRGIAAIQAAMPEFVRHHLDVSLYQVVVMETATSLVVMLEDPDLPKGMRGSSSAKPGFAVELGKDHLQVVQSNFTR